MRTAASLTKLLVPRIVTTAALFASTSTTFNPATPHFLIAKKGPFIMSFSSSFALTQGKISDNSYPVLKELLQLEESPKTAAQQAATAATDKLKQANDKEAIDDGYLFDFWSDTFRAAEQVPAADHPALERLVLFVKELVLKGDIGVKVWDNRVWNDLPVLPAALRENLNGPNQINNEAKQLEINKAWVRFNTFAAKLMAAGINDLSTQALWLLRDALEEESIEPNTKEADREILTAAMWIEFAGPMLFEKILWNPNPTCGEEDSRLLRAGPLYKGGPGLSSDRWLFWMKRFQEVADKVASADSEAKSAAVRAAKLMEFWAESKMKLPGQ